MLFNGSFGERDIEVEINLKDLAKMKEKENSIDNSLGYNNSGTVQKNNDIFNPIFTKEINNQDDLRKLEFYETQLIKEKINYSLLKIFENINKPINSYKISFFNKLKYILNQKYSKLVTAEILYMDIKTKIVHFFNFLKFKQLMKLQKSFNKIKNFSYLKKRQKEQDQYIKKEKENKIQFLNNKLNSIGNTLNEANRKITNLNNVQKKLLLDNRDLKNKINQLTEKMNHLVKVGNLLKESLSNKKNEYNNSINNKSLEIKIQNLQNIIEQKENEKERAMIDVDNFYQSMDVVLSQYESISETILSNCNYQFQ